MSDTRKLLGVSQPDEHASELEAVQRKLTETGSAVDRYFYAFESGTMPEDTWAKLLGAQTRFYRAPLELA